MVTIGLMDSLGKQYDWLIRTVKAAHKMIHFISATQACKVDRVTFRITKGVIC